jgi:hypothetical protein
MVVLAFSLLPATANAQRATTGEKSQPTDKMVTGTVTQPLSDVNLKRREIPPELLAIRDNPYALDGLRTCNAIIAAVAQLNAVLGPDLDEIIVNDGPRKRREGVIKMAGGVITGLIPFRSLIREVSGANKADVEFNAAIYAGVVRRGFLKGYGQQRRCLPPGRPLTSLEQAQNAASQIIVEPEKE